MRTCRIKHITMVFLSRLPVLLLHLSLPSHQLSNVELCLTITCLNVKARSQDPTAPISALPCPESDEYAQKWFI